MKFQRPLLALALFGAIASPALAAVAGPDVKPCGAACCPCCRDAGAAVIPAPSGGDSAIRPQDDLFRHVNGKWLQKTAIPGDKKSFGSFMILREEANANVRKLLVEAEKEGSPARSDRNGQLIGNYFHALNDLAALDRVGAGPLRTDLDRIAAVTDMSGVARTLGSMAAGWMDSPVQVWVSPDDKNPLVNAVHWSQGGLGMPDRDYYTETGEKAEGVRTAYRDYLAELFRLAGDRDPKIQAEAVMALETAIAKLHWARADRRDSVKSYNPIRRDSLVITFPGFDWQAFATASGMPKGIGPIAREKSYFKAFAQMAAGVPVDTWKAYMRSRVLDGHAKFMGTEWRAASHKFHGEKLEGLTQAEPTWRTAVEATNDALGEAVGARYVKKHFPPAAKAKMQDLVGNLLTAYRHGVRRLDWMSPSTRKAAQAKLAKLRVKIGYPDKWRGYDGLVVRRDDAIGNVLRANRYSYARDMAEAGGPVDRARWGMTPQTVNAYYSPVGNEIVFPAAIMQPPFFDMKRDDAYNYGGIGAVIGHEISHGFDDEGRRYDADGRLRDWWRPSDAKAFNARAARLVTQYASYEALPGEKVNGKLTLGENIADLAGVGMALEAYHLATNGRAGIAGDRRFFTGYALIWRSKSRPEWLHQRLVSDSHSPEQFRINGVVTNLDAFYKAYGLAPGDKLYKNSADRVRIW